MAVTNPEVVKVLWKTMKFEMNQLVGSKVKILHDFYASSYGIEENSVHEVIDVAIVDNYINVFVETVEGSNGRELIGTLAIGIGINGVEFV